MTNTLTCPSCGNSDVWRNASMDRDGNSTAECGQCGRTVTSTGGVTMRNTTGGMRQDR